MSDSRKFRTGDDIFESIDLSENTSSAGNAESSEPSFSDPGFSRTERRKTEERKARARELNSAAGTVDRKTVRQEKDKKKKSRVRKIVFWTVLEVLTLLLIFVYGYFLRSWNMITRPEVDEKNIENPNLSAEKKEEMERGWWTFAVFGVDGRNASDLVSRGLNSDVILLVNINQDNGDIRLCSVFRDTYLNINEKNAYRKINQAYSEGGPEQALAALNKNLDLNIKNYVTFNWKAVADGINILGGIDDIDISKAELYYINAFITETVNATKIGSHQLTHTGPQHLDGVQAVAYGRLRLMDDDYARTERQKKVIKACFEKAKHSSFSVLNNIMVVCFPEVATNIGFNNVVAMAQNITKYNISASGGFPWQRSEPYISSVGDVVVPATLESNVRKLHEFLFDDADYEPSKAVLNYSETIKEKSHVYKEGQVVESVRTDGGLISPPKTTAASTAEGENSSAEKEEESSKEKKSSAAEYPTDENGEIVFPTDENGENCYLTDENGDPVFPVDEDGEIIYLTDENGEVVYPTDENGDPVLPGKKRTGELVAGEPTHADDQNHSLNPGETDRNGLNVPGGNTAPDGSSMVPGSQTADGKKKKNNENTGRTDGPGGSSTQENVPGGKNTREERENTPSGNEAGPGGENTSGTPSAPGSGSTSGTSPVPGGSTSDTPSVPGGGSTSGTPSAPGGGNTSGTPSAPGSSNTSGSSSAPGSGSSSGSSQAPGGGSNSPGAGPGSGTAGGSSQGGPGSVDFSGPGM